MEEIDIKLDKICEFSIDDLEEIIKITRERKKIIVAQEIIELRENIISTMKESASNGINTATISVGQYREDTIKRILKEFNIRRKCSANWIQRSGYCGWGRWQINLVWKI